MNLNSSIILQKLNLRLRFALLWLISILPSWALLIAYLLDVSHSNTELLRLVMLGSVISGILALLLFKSTRRDITDLNNIVNAFHNENYEKHVADNSEGVFHHTTISLNQLGRHLTRKQAKLSAATDEINNASEELIKLASIGQRSSEDQKTAINQITTSAEQMSGSISAAAETAQKTATMAQESNQLAQKSEDTVLQLNKEIENIDMSVSSTINKVDHLQLNFKKIGKIVETIKDITEQTNLLALNAAIESARAGDQGKGFAVVSEEVRKLAHRTAESSNEISQLVDVVQQDVTQISNTMSHVKDSVGEGVIRANDTEETLKQIQSQANQQLKAFEEIVNTLDAQSKNSNDVAIKIESIAQQAHENENTIQQTNATAEYLSKLAIKLN